MAAGRPRRVEVRPFPYNRRLVTAGAHVSVCVCYA